MRTLLNRDLKAIASLKTRAIAWWRRLIALDRTQLLERINGRRMRVW